MDGATRLRPDVRQQRAILSNNKGGALAGKRAESFRAELTVDRSVAVGQQGKVKIVLVGEFLLQTNRVRADSDALGVELTELGGQVTKVTAFLRSKRRLRLRVEEQDHRAILEQVAQPHLFAVFVEGNEVPHVITSLHGVTVASRTKGRARASVNTRAK